MTQIKQAKIENRKVADLTNWEDNPRSIVKEDFERLKKQIIKLGMYKPLLVNADNIVLGGNMRLRALTDLGAKEVAVTVVDATDPATMLEYALSDNDQVGVTDDLKLAELVHLNPIDTSLYKVQANILRPLESIVNPPDPVTEGGGDDVDKSDLDESLDTYLNGNIKQIVLYYDNEQYGKIVDMLTNLGERFNIEDNTGIITKLIEDAYNA
jgi:hypothetical protein